jgi:hypothetical protein
MLHKLSTIPTVFAYLAGFAGIRPLMSTEHLTVLQCQYHALSRTVTASQLAASATVRGGHSVVNAHYGRLGHMLEEMGVLPGRRHVGTYRWWAVLSSGWTASGSRFFCQMLPAVADALEIVGWVTPAESRCPRRFAWRAFHRGGHLSRHRRISCAPCAKLRRTPN